MCVCVCVYERKKLAQDGPNWPHLVGLNFLGACHIPTVCFVFSFVFGPSIDRGPHRRLDIA